MIEEHIDVSLVSFFHDPTTFFLPLPIFLAKDASPVKLRLRNYPKGQGSLLQEMTTKLVSVGMAYTNPAEGWGLDPLLVHKLGPAKCRFTEYLRTVINSTLTHLYLMPRMEAEMPELTVFVFCSKFSMSNGYWKPKLAEASRECKYFITPDGVFKPTRYLHGTANDVFHLQSALPR